MSLFKKIKEAEKFKKQLKEDKKKDIPLDPAPSGIYLDNSLSNKSIELSMSEFVLIKELVGRSMKYANLPRIKNSEESKSILSLNKKLVEIV